MLEGRTLRGVKAFPQARRVAAVLATVVLLVMPAGARAQDASPPESTAPHVVSEAPVPAGEVAGGPAPQIGPFDATVGASGIGGVWWLVGFGGLQLAGLFVITRRARARLSASDAAS